MVVGVDTRTEAQLRSDRVKKVPAPFVVTVFHPFFDGAGLKKAGHAAMQEVKVNLARGVQKLPKEGAGDLKVKALTWLEQLGDVPGK